MLYRFCLALALMAFASGAWAHCPGCIPTANETRAEIVARCDVVLLAQWSDAAALTDQDAAYTEYEIVIVGKDRPFLDVRSEGEPDRRDEPPAEPLAPPAEGEPPTAKPVAAPRAKALDPAAAGSIYARGRKVRLAQFRGGTVGDLYLLTGTRTKSGTVDWEAPVEITETAFHYVMQAPSPEEPQPKRLAYFLKFLESSNDFIANDAYNEFALAAFEDVLPLQDQLPLEKLRTWIQAASDGNGPVTSRSGLYGVLLGIGGTRADAEFLKAAMIDRPRDTKLGMEGAIIGYLFLSGAEGVRILQAQILSAPESTFDSIYPVLMGIDMVWTYGRDRVPAESLIAAMRSILDHPRAREFAILALSRWKDWESTERLVDLYDRSTADEDGVRNNIITFMLNCARATREVEGQLVPISQASRAAEFIERLRRDDPVAIERAERLTRPAVRKPRQKPDAG